MEASSATEAARGRLPGLDGLRAAAAAMVFLHHAQLPGLRWATAGMDSGVIIFFALSGYLIYVPFARAFTHGGSVPLRDFAVRRLLRIVPAYLVAAFLIAALFYPWMLGDPIGLAISTHSSVVVVWTLQIEVMFYVLLPIFAWSVRRLSSANRVRVILGFSAGSMCFTAFVMARTLASGALVWAPDVSTVANYLWAFGAGMLIAEFQVRGSLRRPLPIPLAVAGIGLIAVSVLVHAPKFLDVPASVGSAIVIAVCVSRPAPGRWSRLFVAGGAISYSVYLWHEAIVDAIDRPVPTWSGAVLALAVTVLVSALVYLLVERPANRLARTIGRRLARIALAPIPSAALDRDSPGLPVAYAVMPVESPSPTRSIHG